MSRHSGATKAFYRAVACLARFVRAIGSWVATYTKGFQVTQEGGILLWPRLAGSPHALGPAERRLKQSESLLRIARRTALLGGWAVDVPTSRVEWSDEVCTIHEMPAGSSPSVEEGINFYAPEYREVIRNAFHACIEEGNPYDLELQIITAKGRRVWVRTVGEPVRDANGKVVRVEGAFQEISRRKNVEEKLRLSEERFRLLSQATNDAVWDCDLVTNKVWWSDGFDRLFGVGREEVMGDIKAWAKRVHPDDRGRVVHGIESAIAGSGTSWSAEYRFRREDGSYTVAHNRGYIVRADDGRAVRMMGGMTDISERIKAEEALRESAREITQILESITDGFFVLNSEWRFVYLNPRAAELLQRQPADLLGKHVWNEFPQAQQTAFYAQYQRAMREQVAVNFEEHYAPLGIWVEVTAYPSAKGLSVYFTDITERKHAQEVVQRYALRQGKLAEFGRLALAGSDIDELLHQAAAIVCDALGIEFANVLQLGDDGYARVVRAGRGWNEEHIGHRLWAAGTPPRNCSGLAAPEPVIVQDVATDPRGSPSEVLLAHGIRSVVEVPIGGAEKPLTWLGAYAREPSRFDEEDLVFLQSLAHTLQAVLERRKAEERAAHLVQFDGLTGLPNRHLLRDRLEQLLMQLRRSRRQTAVMLLDLDRFSAVNDALDHAAGDELLRCVAERLQSCLRPGDTLARVGGDKFAVVLAHLRSAEDAWRVAQKFMTAIKRPFETRGQRTYLTSSFGIALFPDDGDDAETLLKHASTAMYRAKERGGDNYQYYIPAMHHRAAERLRLETHLRAALEHGMLDEQFALHYQPKISSATGRWTGLEALMRWHHPEHGGISPAQFIPVLEETGLIAAVGQWVLTRALADYHAWQAAGLAPPPVAVNVSLVQLRDPGFVQTLRDAIDVGGTSFAPLQLEITESVIMQNVDDIVAKLRELKAMGVQIAVDDFGTGYSSLAYLATLPLDALKVDRAFIARMHYSKDNMAIVSSIISLAHALKLAVVAEGVEEEKQAKRLRTLKCDEMQGFLFSRPIAAGEIAALLGKTKQSRRRAKLRSVRR